jgi:hypothetical protein
LENNQTQFLATLEEAAKLRHRKMYDYGLSYQTHGSYGIVVRMTDKMQRLCRLTEPGAKPNNETVEDTLLDIVNYAAMCIMERRREKNADIH